MTVAKVAVCIIVYSDIRMYDRLRQRQGQPPAVPVVLHRPPQTPLQPYSSRACGWVAACIRSLHVMLLTRIVGRR